MSALETVTTWDALSEVERRHLVMVLRKTIGRGMPDRYYRVLNLANPEVVKGATDGRSYYRIGDRSVELLTSLLNSYL